MAYALKIVAGALVGAAVGYAVYRFIGCRTGTCILVGNPVVPTVMFGVMGAMMAAGK